MNYDKQNSDLDQLAQLNEKLLERSRGRRTDYKLVDSEIIKTAPEPVPVTVKEQMRDMLESRISNDTSVNSTIPQQDRSGYVTEKKKEKKEFQDASSATWQFSSHSFSPRSVVSVNGGGTKMVYSKPLAYPFPFNAAVQTAHIESEKQHWPYMPARLGPVTDSAQSTMTREFNENFERRIERYASLPTLDSETRGTLIKIKDDKPRGIMKRRELETKDQMMYAEEPRQVARADHWDEQRIVSAKPKVTETIQRVEEHKRIEEIERRVQRKEKKEKKHRSHRSYHHHRSGGGGGGSAGGGSNREAYAYNGYSDEGSSHNFSVTSTPSIKHVYEIHTFLSNELIRLIRDVYSAAEQAYRYRSNSLSRQNGYLPAHESYMRSVTTRREKDGRYYDDGRLITNGSLSNGRYGSSISDSLRRGELRYNPNGDIREVHHSSSGRSGRIHKSLSTRDVYDSGSGVNYDGDYYRSSSYRRGSQQSGGPFVEFPPTLPRDREAPIPPPHRARAPSNDFYRPIIKSRSYADWDEGRGFSQSIRRRNDDMTRLENEFRDSLLMPLPNISNNCGNMYERDHRHEQIPGGYEIYDREVKSNSGRRINKDGNPTDFNVRVYSGYSKEIQIYELFEYSEMLGYFQGIRICRELQEESQECSYKRETESDRRR
ncbi:CRE-PAT-12 protein [Dirofilaria immitis]|nr:CRE-PAT-12 protein [Dirofilaria immitis]